MRKRTQVYEIRRWLVFCAALIAVLAASAASAAGQDAGSAELIVRARGTTGVEVLQVRDGNTILGQTVLGTAWDEFRFSVSAASRFETLSVGFINNQHEPVDRNVSVDWVQLGDDRRETNSSAVWSTGKWTAATGCTSGPSTTEVLSCAGFLHFGGEPSGSTIIAHAVGSTGTENLELHLDGVAVATNRVTNTGNVFSSESVTSPIEFVLPRPVDHGRLRVAFVNDGDGGINRDVRIDRIVVDGATYRTTDSRVESLGSVGADNCAQGFVESPTLVCNGWFQLPPGEAAAPPPGSQAPTVDALALSVEVMADGLTNPWGMGFLPNGDLLFTERLGRISLLQGSTVSTIDADFSNLGPGTSGLLGLAIDADFASNRRFYTCQGQDSPPRQQIVAWELSTDSTRATKMRNVIDLERNATHSGCRLKVDSQGFLWATLGDDFRPTAAQDPQSLHGKVLRIDPVTGAAHPDNTTSGPARDPRIFSLGHRNPQGIDFHPGTGQAWVVDHGPDTEDEINALQLGGNYGWNPLGSDGEYDELGRRGTDPDIAGAVAAAWSSGSSTIAPGSIAFLDGAHWGDFDGAAAMPTLKDERLHLFRFNAAGMLVDRAVPVELDQSSHKRLRSALMGPDGALYLTTSNSGFGNDDVRADSILRVTPSGGIPGPVPDGVTPPVSPSAPALFCNDLLVTVDIAKGQTPTAGDDVIRGTSGDDEINALGGNDTICGLGGDDVINGGAGFDKVFAGIGNDMILGGAGNDRLVGGSGNDIIFGGVGNDRIQGGDGADEMHGGGGTDRIGGGAGNDLIRGGSHDDELFGHLGRDRIFGDAGNDLIRGGAWIDEMDGGPGNADGCTLTDPGGSVETRRNCERGVFGR